MHGLLIRDKRMTNAHIHGAAGDGIEAHHAHAPSPLFLHFKYRYLRFHLDGIIRGKSLGNSACVGPRQSGNNAAGRLRVKFCVLAGQVDHQPGRAGFVESHPQ